MLVIQVLVALLLGVGNFGTPSAFLHNLFGSENGVFVMVVSIEMGLVLDQMGIVDVSPLISITNAWYVPGGVTYGTGYELAEFYGFWHDGGPFKRMKAPTYKDRSPHKLMPLQMRGCKL